MAIPKGILTPDESVVLDVRPHWVRFVIPSIISFAVLLAWVWASRNFDGVFPKALAIGLLVALVRLTAVFLPWWATCFAVTSERIIVRSGVIAKHGIEIPLDKINTVFFNQTLLERVVGAGDLIIESASESGRQTFADVAHPNEVQQVIYRAKEDFQQRERERQGEAYARHQSAPQTTPTPSATAELERLWNLLQSGAISQDEYETLKARLVI
jgi:uncharacterized membrane protein YdbT with pleckstrin-like domain